VADHQARAHARAERRSQRARCRCATCAHQRTAAALHAAACGRAQPYGTTRHAAQLRGCSEAARK
jgi:hypothetical protein